jgi:predicted phage-related endonuclease
MLDLEIFTDEECPQNSEAWYAIRRGIVTASTFSDVLAGGKGITRNKLMRTIASDILGGAPAPAWEGNQHTKRGHEMEGQVRDLYEATSELPVTRVGFCRRGRIGASPDSLVGDEGLLEIKTAAPHIQLERLDAGVLPSEYAPQVQGQLLVTGRQWCDFRSYWPGLPQLKLRVYRDLEYLSRLNSALQQFVREVDAIVEKYRQ